jgi:hypothetical protein
MQGVGYMCTIPDTGDSVVTKEFKHPDSRVTVDSVANSAIFTRYPKPTSQSPSQAQIALLQVIHLVFQDKILKMRSFRQRSLTRL